MIKRFCDRCSVEIASLDQLMVIEVINPRPANPDLRLQDAFDLCKTCAEEIVAFIRPETERTEGLGLLGGGLATDPESGLPVQRKEERHESA